MEINTFLIQRFPLALDSGYRGNYGNTAEMK